MNPTHLLWIALRGTIGRGLPIDDAQKGTVSLVARPEVDVFALTMGSLDEDKPVSQGTLDEVLAYAKKKRWSIDR
jgi:hypothetical protein